MSQTVRRLPRSVGGEAATGMQFYRLCQYLFLLTFLNTVACSSANTRNRYSYSIDKVDHLLISTSPTYDHTRVVELHDNRLTIREDFVVKNSGLSAMRMRPGDAVLQIRDNVYPTTCMVNGAKTPQESDAKYLLQPQQRNLLACESVLDLNPAGEASDEKAIFVIPFDVTGPENPTVWQPKTFTGSILLRVEDME